MSLTATTTPAVNWTVPVKNCNPLTKKDFLSPVAKWNTIRAQLRMFSKKEIFDHLPHPGLTSPGKGKCNIMQKVSALAENTHSMTSPNARYIQQHINKLQKLMCRFVVSVSSSTGFGRAAKSNHRHQRGSTSLFKQQLFPHHLHPEVGPSHCFTSHEPRKASPKS